MKCCEEVRGSECHCAGCHVTYTNLTLFDAHQDVDYDRDPVIICRQPSEIALDRHGNPVPVGSQQAVAGTGLMKDARGCWGTLDGVKARERYASQLARARSERVGAT